MTSPVKTENSEGADCSSCSPVAVFLHAGKMKTAMFHLGRVGLVSSDKSSAGVPCECTQVSFTGQKNTNLKNEPCCLFLRTHIDLTEHFGLCNEKLFMHCFVRRSDD